MRSHSLRETPEIWSWFELTKRSIETHLKESAEKNYKYNRSQIHGFEGAKCPLPTPEQWTAVPERISQSFANAASVGHRVENIAAFVNNASKSTHYQPPKDPRSSSRRREHTEQLTRLPMSFALPIALTLTALVLPIVALYILKVRLRRVPVSTNLFWKQIFEEKPPRSLWQQFRHWYSLLLQLLLLLLIVLALTNPYFSWQSQQARRIVMVVDNSASMRATDVRPTRLDAAKEAAAEVIEGLRFQDELSIVLAGESPEVVASLTGHSPTLHEALRSIVFSDGPTSLQPAIELAHKLIGSHSHGEIIVLTDGCVDDAAAKSVQLSPADGRLPTEKADDKTAGDQTAKKLEPVVEYRLFSTDAPNVGITQFQVRRSLADALGYETLVSVKNASSVAVSCRIELTLDDIPIDVLPLNLQPEELWTRTLEKTSLEGGVVQAALTQIQSGKTVEPLSTSPTTASLDSPAQNESAAGLLSTDGLQTDNNAWSILPARMIQKVLIVTTGNLFLEKVFEANPLVEVSVASEFPTTWPEDSLIILHGRIPDQLPTGNVFVIDPIGKCEYWEAGERLENPLITDQDSASPLMRHFRLDNVVVPEARELVFTKSPQVLASTATGVPIFAIVPRAEGKCLVLTVSLDSSDLAFRTAFPIMVSNALGWFSGTTGEIVPSANSGGVVRIPLTAAVSEPLQLSSPTGIRSGLTPVPAFNDAGGSATVTTGPLNEVGLWTLTASANVNSPVAENANSYAIVAVNLASIKESDLRPRASISSTFGNGSQMSRWLSRPLWIYLTICAVILTCVEWILYQRRFIS
jgi:hypothetical protein